MKTTDKIAEIIRALLMKTVENGATEAEAMGAAAKAYELLGKYQLDMSDVEADAIKTDDVANSRRGAVSIAQQLMTAVGAYCDCVAWSQSGKAKFTGRETNILFATWLLDALDGFCARRILEYAYTQPMGRKGAAGIEAFKFGLVISIRQRLVAAADERDVGERYRIKQANLAFVSKNGVTLRNTKSKVKMIREGDAFRAGHAMGQSATFSRPVNAGAGTLRLAG